MWIAIIASVLAMVASVAICLPSAILGPKLNYSTTTTGNNNAAGSTATEDVFNSCDWAVATNLRQECR